MLFEGGFRISEALRMQIRDIVFDGAGARASVHGKTWSRTVRLITSSPILSQFIDQHPPKRDETSPLWYYFPTMSTLKPMNYRTASIIVKRAAKLSGVKKRVYPHLFRHSAATRDSSYGLDERILEIKYGWSTGSKMAGRYTHIQDQQTVDNAILGVYAKQQIKPPDSTFTPVRCPRCEAPNSVGLRFCGKCGSPLESRISQVGNRVRRNERKGEGTGEQGGKGCLVEGQAR